MLEQIRTFLTVLEEGSLHRAAARLRISQPANGFEAPRLTVKMIDTQVPLFDLHLMLAVSGKERSLAEYNGLFDKVGLRTIKTTPLDNGYVVIETALA